MHKIYNLREAPPNLCTSQGLGEPLGDVTLWGHISAEGISVLLRGLLNDTPSCVFVVVNVGCCCCMDKLLLFHDSAELIPLLFSCIDGVNAEAKGAARMNNLWTSIVLFNIVLSYCSLQ